MSIDLTSKIYVAGHTGLVGSALVRALSGRGYKNLILAEHGDVNLCDLTQVNRFFSTEKPDYVFLAAARVGGIMANKIYPASFVYDNLMIQSNVIHAAHEYDVKKLLFLGSSCIYPKLCPQPIKEEYLLSGDLEPTNRAYAIAKIAGIITCQSYNQQYGTRFISVMPTNLYGPNDNFNLESSHVLPAMIRKFHEAKTNKSREAILFGTGTPRREFLHVDDLADACLFLMDFYESSDIVNIGTGIDLSIKEVAEMIGNIVGYEGEIVWDVSKPDGTPRKLLNVDRLKSLGWRHTIELGRGLEMTYEWYRKNNQTAKL